MRYAVEDGILVIRLDEAPNLVEFTSLLRVIMSDPSVPAGLPLLVDVREAPSAPRAAEVQGVARFFSGHADFFAPVRAILVDTKLQFGMARMGEAYEAMEDRQLAIFRDEAEAKAFLTAAKNGADPGAQAAPRPPENADT